MHGLILLPYYFIGALAALPVLIVVCRLLRVNAGINTLVGGAIGLTLTALVVPLAAGWVHLAAFSGRPMLLLILLSLGCAALDALLAPKLPLSLDRELQEL